MNGADSHMNNDDPTSKYVGWHSLTLTLTLTPNPNS
jgi:hypothetical protein